MGWKAGEGPVLGLPLVVLFGWEGGWAGMHGGEGWLGMRAFVCAFVTRVAGVVRLRSGGLALLLASAGGGDAGGRGARATPPPHPLLQGHQTLWDLGLSPPDTHPPTHTPTPTHQLTTTTTTTTCCSHAATTPTPPAPL